MRISDWSSDVCSSDLVQAPFKITQDLSLTLGDWGLFVKGLYFYDAVNADFREYHPNRITSDNYLDVGFASTPGSELLPINLPLPVSTLVEIGRASCRERVCQYV